MDTMNALVYYGPHDLRLEKRPIPKPERGEVLIRVKAVSICGSDLGAYKLENISDRWQPPIVLGHEFSGEIVRLGDGVHDYKIGQAVTANPILPCGECFYCKHGEINLCPNRSSIGTSIGGIKTDGAMREFMTLPAYTLYPLMDGVSFVQGALMEPLAVSYSAANVGDFGDNESVAIIGAGPIGLMILKFLKMKGNKKIFVSDVIKLRLNLAKANGADEVLHGHRDVVSMIKGLTEDVGVDRVIVAAGVHGIFLKCMEMVRNGGKIVLVALIHHNCELPLIAVVTRGISILGSYMFTSEITDVMELVAKKKINVDDLITSVLPLSEGVDVFNTLCGMDCKEIKVILTND